MHMPLPRSTGLLLLAVLGTATCTSPSPPDETSAASNQRAVAIESPAAATTTPPLPPRSPSSAATIAAIIDTIPAYPGAAPTTTPPWSPPSEFRPAQWGSEWAAHTSDDGRKVLDWYVNTLPGLGWINSPAFASMESFEKKVDGSRKLITVAASPDQQRHPKGATLIRVLIQDND
jgi:hypothetical protein